MLVDEIIKQLEKYKGKELTIDNGWVDYKVISVDEYKGKCSITLEEDVEGE